MNYFTVQNSRLAIIIFLVALISSQLLNINNILPLQWIVISLITTILFFHYLRVIPIQWAGFTDGYFRRKLFWSAFLIRLFVVLFLYVLFTLMTGEPHEFAAGDSLYYHDLGIKISNQIWEGRIFDSWPTVKLPFSDRGYPIFLGIMYSMLFNSILAVRIVHSLLGAWTCMIIYDYSRRNFGEHVARLAGIMTMLLPNLLYYCGLQLKETLMVFLTVVFINEADIILSAGFMKIKHIIVLIVVTYGVFLLRTVLGAVLVFSFITSLLFATGRRHGYSNRIVLFFWFSIAVLILPTTAIRKEVNFFLEESASNQNAQMQNISNSEGGNKLAMYGKSAVFIPIIFIAPFPSFVNIEQDNLMMLSGAYFTKNIYAFFVIISLIIMIKYRLLRKYPLLLSFLVSYLAILALSGFALSERFHLPAVPFLIIMASFGIAHINKIQEKYYLSYLIMICILIIGWNWFKLAGRGLI
jgi:hypothetical protein